MKLAAAALLLLLAACATAVRDNPFDLVGVWGGEHVGLTVGTLDADLQFDCAEGTIVAPHHVAANGSFEWEGTFKRGAGGPVRVGQFEVREEPPPMQATYSGVIREPIMTLSVKLEDGTRLGPYTLERSKEPRLTRCL